MKTYIYLFLLLLATASCSEQTAPDHSVGYLRVENIILSCDTETLPITRAVDAGLKLEIWQGSECVRSYDPGAAELSKRIVLPVGEYTLKAFTPDQTEAPVQTGCIPLKRIRKSNSSWKRKADMDEKPMKAINIVDKKTTKIKAPDVEIKIDVEHSSSIEKRKIDGVTYLLVPLSVTSDIEIDGIRLR